MAAVHKQDTASIRPSTGPPWPPGVIEAARRLIMWTVERYQKEQQQAQGDKT